MRSLINRSLAFGSILLILSACNEEHTVYAPPAAKTFELPVMTVQLVPIPRIYTVPGSVKSDERIQVSSRISGYIQNISVHEGDQVTKGAILVKIDPTEVEGAIRQTLAAVQTANTALSDAERDTARLSGLQKKGVVSNETLRKAKVLRDVARSTLAEAKAALDTAQAARRYVSVKSPFNGIVVMRHKQVGDLATPGVPVLTIESRARLLLRTSVAESRIRNIHTGEQVQVEIDALGKNEIAGVVLRVIPSGDPVTRRYDVEISLPNKPGIYPGMFGRAHFILGSDTSPVVPKAAIVERGGLRGVFVLDQERAVKFRWLRMGREWADRVEIIVGLKDGETILSQNDRRVHDGDVIKSVTKAVSDE